MLGNRSTASSTSSWKRGARGRPGSHTGGQQFLAHPDRKVARPVDDRQNPDPGTDGQEIVGCPRGPHCLPGLDPVRRYRAVSLLAGPRAIRSTRDLTLHKGLPKQEPLHSFTEHNLNAALDPEGCGRGRMKGFPGTRGQIEPDCRLQSIKGPVESIQRSEKLSDRSRTLSSSGGFDEFG